MVLATFVAGVVIGFVGAWVPHCWSAIREVCGIGDVLPVSTRERKQMLIREGHL